MNLENYRFRIRFTPNHPDVFSTCDVLNSRFIQGTPVEIEASSVQVWFYGFNLDRIELILGVDAGRMEVRDRREKLAATANAFINGPELEGRFGKKEARLVRIDR